MPKSGIEEIKKKYKEFIFKNPGREKHTLEDFSYVVKEDGIYFDDIDYENKSSSNWLTVRHMDRLLSCMLYDDIENRENDNEKIKKYLGLFDCWLNNKFHNPNWWWPEIGTPMKVMDAWVVLEKYMTKEQKKAAEEIALSGSYKQNKAIDRWTGANLIWGTTNTMILAVLTEDEEMLRWAVERSMKELVIKDGEGEGIKPDMSFYQHGTLLYSFGYGRSLTDSLSKVFRILSGTEYMPGRKKTELFEHFILDGSRYFTVNNSCDFMTVGRELSRYGNVHLEEFSEYIERMLETEEFERKADLRELYESLKLIKKDKARGVKVFPNSYFITGYDGTSYFSAKGVNKRYICQEAGNGENYLAINFSGGGTVCIMKDGDEYADISPVWDFSMIPGTTALNESEEELLSHTGRNWFSKRGKTDNCSIKCDEKVAVLSMKYKHGPCEGYLTRLIGDGFCVICGSDLKYKYDEEEAEKNPGERYCTQGKVFKSCINQTYAKKDCSVSEGKKVRLSRGETVKNGGFVYKNLTDTVITAENLKSSGRWEKNNTQVAGERPPVVKDIFSIYADHGQAESFADGSYGVCVCEEEKEADVKLILEANRHTVELSNGKIITVDFTEDTSVINIK